MRTCFPLRRHQLRLVTLASLIVSLLIAGKVISRRLQAREIPPAHGLAADGPLATRTLEFPDLVDTQRENRRVPIKVHVPEQPGPYPLIVFSHGGGGHWDANFAQARHLATHGYVVLCLEHIGSNTAVMKRSMRFGENLRAMTRDATEVLGRPRDVHFAIDQAEEWNRSHAQLKGQINLDQIGMIGHSYGAFTTLTVCGMRPALDWLTPAVPPGKGLAEDLRDPRIDCGVALSPQGPGEPFFLEESYQTLATPLLGISGTRDAQQGADPENRRIAFRLWPAGDKHLIWLTNADHTSFSDSTGSTKRMLPSAAREGTQPVVRAASLMFFDAHLKATNQQMAFSIDAGMLKPYCNSLVPDLQVFSK